MIVESLNKKYRPLEKRVKNTLKKALKKLKKSDHYLEVYFISDPVMRQLVRKFQKKNKVTNVLAFPASRFPHPTHKNYLGEIYLAPDYIRRREQNLIRLALHGLLHLLGYKHSRERDRIRMERLEAKLLKHLNV